MITKVAVLTGALCGHSAQVLRQQHDYTGAVESCVAALRAAPDRAGVALALQAHIEEEAGRWAQADEDVRAATLAVRAAAAKHRRGASQASECRVYMQAEELLQRARSVFPTHSMLAQLECCVAAGLAEASVLQDNSEPGLSEAATKATTALFAQLELDHADSGGEALLQYPWFFAVRLLACWHVACVRIRLCVT
jgi:tetratricopeptide (TPR) repeat protein